MKPKTSQSPSIRPYGQRSIVSNFSPKVEEKKTIGASPASTSSLSLLEFLDRKLEKSSKKTLQEKSSSSESAIPKVLSGGACDGKPCSSGIAKTKLFEQLKHSSKDPQQATIHTPLQYPNNKRDSLKRKSFSSPDNFQQSSGRLLVLGDDPKPKRRPQVQKRLDERPQTIFNHYADGGGWWDTDMVGLDSDEVGSTEIWEGMGSTTIEGL